MDIILSCGVLALGVFGIWAVLCDMRRGVASARGFSLDRLTQPRRYRALMIFNATAVTLLCAGGVLMVARTIAGR